MYKRCRRIQYFTSRNTNFFRAFTILSSVPAIYIQQFWNTMTYDAKTGVYSVQLDEQWFTLSADLLLKALDITPIDPAHPFESPPTGDAVMDFVNQLGYPEPIQFMSKMRVNSLQQHWRAILSLINQCLTGKTSGSDKPRHPVLQMLWGIVTRTNVDHAELLWEEFVQGIQTLFSHKDKTLQAYFLKESSKGKPSLKLVDEEEEVQHEPEPQDEVTYADLERALKMSLDLSQPQGQVEDEATDLERALKMSLDSFEAQSQRHVKEWQIHERVTEEIKKLMDVAGKGKAIVTEEQAAHLLLDLHKSKKKSTTKQFILQRRDHTTTGPSSQPQDETSKKVVQVTSLPSDSTNVAEKKSDSERTKSRTEAEVQKLIKNKMKKQPTSPSGKLSSMKNLDDTDKFGDDFLNDVPTEDEPANTSVPPLSTTTTLAIPPHPLTKSPTDQELVARVAALERKMDSWSMHSRSSTSQPKTLPPNSLLWRIMVYRPRSKIMSVMFESGSYNSHTDHEILYNALELSMDRDHQDELHEELDTPSSSSKQKQTSPSGGPTEDVPIPDEVYNSDTKETENAHLPKITTTADWFKHIQEEERPATPEPKRSIPLNDFPEADNSWANAFATTYQDPEENKLLRKTGDMGSFIKWFYKRIRKKKLSKSDIEGLTFNVVKGFHKNSISLQFQMEECHKILIDKVDLFNPGGHRIMPDISKPFPLGGPPEQIISVISLKSYERYVYNYLREIVIRRADYKEYKISEADFKHLHSNDFEDLYLLHLQGKLNHLSKSDKVHLHTSINLWIRNIIVRKRGEDLQLGIKSYQTKLNLKRPNWDAFDFLFKEDYTIINKPRIIIYKDRNNKKMMRISEVHKFSDGTLTRIRDKLDFMVKDYVLFKYNPGMEKRI
uniref:Monodehydroascorbate reductase n=1 Tax=Tanacetum cinerariifolium TaxID=118510 RepID=A0A6L2K661_TANCI|nr:monodehydroascorbate reductase [Tanacetum cinerariifolium]